MWDTKCDVAFDTLKEKLASVLILVCPVWHKEFHVHIKTYEIALGAILIQPREGNLDHHIYFSRRNIYMEEKNYTTTEMEDIATLYSL